METPFNTYNQRCIDVKDESFVFQRVELGRHDWPIAGRSRGCEGEVQEG